MTSQTTVPAVLAVIVLSASAVAQAPEFPVDAVELQGLERVSEQLVRSKIEAQPGQTFNPRAIARDLRRLYELGFFTNIKVDLDRSGGRAVITYIFEEQRVIEEVRIAGNKKVKLRQIRSVLNWKEGDSFAREAYDEERDAVRDLYRSKGFMNATVDIIVEEVSSARVRITYIIEEGKKARIRRIAFEGNAVLNDRKLQNIIKTRRAWWFLGGRYDEEKFEVDLHMIIDEYGNRGRLEADIPATEFTYSPNGKRLYITIQVEEGPEYTVDTMELADNVVFDEDELFSIIKVKAGDIHNKGQVEEDADLIRTGYEDSGYVSARVRPQVTLDRENKTTRVVHRINEGDLRYIREIKITGNAVTKGEVIRRRILLIPGERFDGSAFRSSQNRLESTGYFDATRLTLEEIVGDDRFTNLLVDVDEGKTGSFDMGIGYSTEERIGAFVGIRRSNFDISNWPSLSGGGQQLETRLSIGAVRSQYRLSFTDPEIFGYPFSFGFDFFDESFRTTGGSTFTQDVRGAQLRLAKALSPYITVRTSLRYTSVKISDFGFSFSEELNELRDPGTTIASGWGISRNTLDHYRDPSSGATHDLSLEIAGLGGDNEFVKIQEDSTWYWALDDEKKWILSFRTRTGWSTPYGSTNMVPLQDRFFAGGTSTVRGYDTRDIGPTVRTFGFFGAKERIGGEFRVLNSVEAKYKLNKMLRLYTFLDTGGVWRTAADFDLGGIKTSIGIGIGFDIPRMGPLRLDYGFPLNPDSDQGSGRLHLVTGFRF